MDPTQEIQSQDMTVDQAVSVLLRDLPKPVQDFVTGPERAKITIALSQKYGLHVDTAGAFERAFIFMLLGIYTPAEFVKNLQEAGVPDESIQGLTNDVNEQVFMKLRAAEEKTPGAVAPAPISTPAPVSPPILQVSVPVTPPPPVPSPISASIPPVQQFVPPAPQVVKPTDVHEVRTMASDINLVKSGAYQERQETVTQPVPPPFVPPSAPPIPPSVPPAPQPQVAAPSAPKTPAPQSENRDALHDILKQYGVDPYREPPE